MAGAIQTLCHALLAQSAGGWYHRSSARRSGHIRDEELHVKEIDPRILKGVTDEMVSIACDVKPNAALLCREKITMRGVAVRSQEDLPAVQSVACQGKGVVVCRRR